MTEKMQMLFAHIACVAMIVTCFWLSATVLKDQPQLGHIVIGLGLFLWGKIGFKPSDAVVDTILESLTPKQVKKVQSIHPPPPAVDAPVVVVPVVVPLRPATDDGHRAIGAFVTRACVRCGADLPAGSSNPWCETCSPPQRAA